MRFSQYYPQRGEFQKVSGYFYVSEDGNYTFYVGNIERLNNKYHDRVLLSLSINNTTLPARKGGNLSLQKSWHYINFHFNPQPHIQDSDLSVSKFSVYWGEGNKIGNPLQPLNRLSRSQKITINKN